MEVLYNSDRAFVLKYYNDNKGYLLLRSTKYFLNPTEKNIDLVFYGTYYIGIPITLHGIKLRAGTPEEFKVFLKQIENIALYTSGMFSEKDFFAIESQGGVFYVIATHYAVDENLIPLKETRAINPPTINGWDNKHKAHYETVVWRDREGNAT